MPVLIRSIIALTVLAGVTAGHTYSSHKRNQAKREVDALNKEFKEKMEELLRKPQSSEIHDI